MKRFLVFALILVSLLVSSSGFQAAAQDQTPPVSPDGRVVEEAGVLSSSSPDQPEIAAPESTLTQPGQTNYDSGWVAILPDQAVTLVHNLGGDPDDYVVDMQYQADTVDGINVRYFGGVDFGANPAPGHNSEDRVGAYWRSLDASTITIYRRPEDTYAEKIRIRIRVDTSANYDSGWVALAVNSTIVLNHNLGGNADDYLVDLEYKSAGSGINQRYYSGADFGSLTTVGAENDREGAYWRSLTNTSITVFRRAEDIYATQVRVRLWLRPRATYDSGWVAINPDQAIILIHNIGGDIGNYVVDMEFNDGGANGINQRNFGGADTGVNPSPGLAENDRVGAYWRTLDASTITIYRRPQDIYAPQMRIRIYDYWDPPMPDYDSGWMDMTQDVAQTLTHNLGGNANDYYVSMMYRNTDSGINLRYYGGADFGNKNMVGNDSDRVGLYWRTLTSSSITVYRRPEDTYAAQVRVRIWRMPKPSYDSGFFAISPGAAATTLSHNLGGSYQGEYLVDFQYYNASDGINQRYYGGADFGNKTTVGSDNDRQGAYWRSLDNTSITVYRRPEDTYATQVRVRIWRVALPDYDSGWIAMTQDVATPLIHNLGGYPDAYLVDFYQWDTDIANTMNQRHLGGADFGTLPPVGYAAEDRVGAYWRSLTDAGVTVYRRPDDGFSDYVRIRIWNYTPYLYLPVIKK